MIYDASGGIKSTVTKMCALLSFLCRTHHSGAALLLKQSSFFHISSTRVTAGLPALSRFFNALALPMESDTVIKGFPSFPEQIPSSLESSEHVSSSSSPPSLLLMSSLSSLKMSLPIESDI
jgi:hypothetical protein